MKKYVLIGFYVMLFITVITFSNATINDDLLLYLTMDDTETSGTTSIDLVNGFNFTINNALTGQTNAVVDEVYYYDGGDSLNRNIDSSFDTGTGNFSVSLWVNITEITTIQDPLYHLWNSADINDHSRAYLYETGGVEYLWVGLRQDAGNYCQRKGSVNVDDGQYHHIVIYRDGVSCDSLKAYFDNSPLTLNLHNEAGSNWNLANFDRFRIARDEGGSNYLDNGEIDEFAFYDKALSTEEVNAIYQNNSAGYQYPFPVPSVPTLAVNTSFYLVDFNASDIIFATDTFFNAFTFEYNITERVNVTFVSSFNLNKLTGAGTNVIYGRIIRNEGDVISEELLRTVSGTNNVGATGFNPIVFEEEAGSHNLTFQFRRTGNGNIELSNIDFILMQMFSTELNNVRVDSVSESNTFTDTEFSKMINYSVDTQQSVVVSLAKINVNGTLPSVSRYRFQDDTTNGTGLLRRSLLSSTEVGSLSIGWFSIVNYNSNLSLAMQTDSNPVTYNSTVINFDMQDSENNTIELDFSVLNESTYNAGTHLLNNLNHTPVNGDSVLLYSVIGFNSSTGLQTPTFIVNSTNQSLDCYSEKQRTISTGQVGNVYTFVVCNSNLELNKTYQFNSYLIVDTGETLNIETGSLSAFDTTMFEIGEVPTPKEMTIFTNLVNNTKNYNNNSLPIYYNFSIGIFNTIDQADCNLIVDGVINDTHLARNDSINYLFNFSTVGIEQNFNLSVDCNNSEISASSGDFSYLIDTVEPLIQSDFENNTQTYTAQAIIFNVNFTDENLFAYNVSWFDINGNEIQSVFAENLTGGFAENTSSYVPITVTNGTIRAQAWDSHTDNIVRDVDFYIDENGKIHAAGIMFDGDFKLYGKEKLITYFYHDGDRYKFKATFEDTKLYHNFNISANGWVYINDIHGYKGHFVNLGERRWMDFEGNNIDEVEITNLGNSNFNIEVELINPSDEVEFESIGDLNYNEVTYSYTVVDSSVLNNQLLQDIKDELTITNNLLRIIGDGSMILALIILIIALFYFGFKTQHYVLWSGAGAIMLLVALNQGVRAIEESGQVFYKAMTFVFLIIGLAVLVAGIGFQVMKFMSSNKDDFYTNL